MVNKRVFVLILNFVFFGILTSKGQEFFSLNGNIKNLNENEISITVYKNWVEPPLEYELKVDKKGNYIFQTPLTEIAYVDLNIGEKGYYYLVIEPKDKITLNADYNDFENSIAISGDGSQKWKYYRDLKKFFEDDKDWQIELIKLKKISRKGYFDLTNYLLEEQIKILNTYKPSVSEAFFSLMRADIYGKMSQFELEYLVGKNIFSQAEFDRFQLKTFNNVTQEKSYFFGNFVESLIEKHNMMSKKYENDNLLDYESIKAYFDRNDIVGKNLIDRILATKIISYLDVDGPSEKNKLIVGNYKEFSKNKNYTNYVINKLSRIQGLLPGSQAQNFILENEKGDLISLKDFRGKNILLSFYTGWCGPCIVDQNTMHIIKNYFLANNDLVILSVSLDNRDEFKRVLEANRFPGVHLFAPKNSSILKDYVVESVPQYYLINKSGIIISEQIIEPSLDEGRALIKQIERLLYGK
jgi:peroxiredoxin